MDRGTLMAVSRASARHSVLCVCVGERNDPSKLISTPVTHRTATMAIHMSVVLSHSAHKGKYTGELQIET
eukprot:2189507-Prymnesium_polylepis.2